MDKSHNKIISDIETDKNVVSVKAPFRLFKDRKRRYIRLEISEPIEYAVLKDQSGGFWPQGNGPTYHGGILNLSAGGVLIISNDPADEGSIVVLKMTLQEIEVLDNVIGMVKRTEHSGGEWLIGVEFITKEFLQDSFSKAELDIIMPDLTSFDARLQDILARYIYNERISATGKQ
ncbi:MAG: PilZ domain-containing protein [Candidatus Zixiibacteriota bacterium]|nr:MAG: PilZ domain-containing protein [candidate division Zixibacteria bacterium]